MTKEIDPTTSDEVLLATEQLCKSFAGFTAVNEVSLRVRRGRIHALIGPNGAGKSTLFGLLTKFISPSRGSITFDGKDITHQSAAITARSGMVRSFQISAIFAGMTVEQNIRTALQSKLGIAHRFWSSSKVLRGLRPRTQELLSEVGLEELAGRQAGSLAYGQRRALELATTLAMDPKMLLLDEPTQGMGHEDVHRVTGLIKRVAQGRTVMVVEHNMSVVAEIADTISVLQRGAIIAEGSYAEVSSDAAVIGAYLGRRQAQARMVA